MGKFVSDDSTELRKYEIDANIKRQEIRAGIWKVLLGTSIVGVAAAGFPFAQQYAVSYFAHQKDRAAWELEKERSEYERTTLNRDFLNSISGEGRSKYLEERIILAEYYKFLANDDEEKERWKDFWDYLIKLRKEAREAAKEAARLKAANTLRTATREAEEEAARLTAADEVDEEELAVAEARARFLNESKEAEEELAVAETRARFLEESSVAGGIDRQVTSSGSTIRCEPHANSVFVSQITLLSRQIRKYVVAEPDGRLDANRNAVGPWEKFQLLKNEDGSYSLCSHHKTYVVAEPNGNVLANRISLGPWEKFTLISNDDGSISLKSHHNTFISITKKESLSANANEIGVNEKFSLETL